MALLTITILPVYFNILVIRIVTPLLIDKFSLLMSMNLGMILQEWMLLKSRSMLMVR